MHDGDGSGEAADSRRARRASGGGAARPRDHAIEVRLNAEDPENGFCAGSRAIERFQIPTGPGVRIDTGVAVGRHRPFGIRLHDRQDHRLRPNRKEAFARLQRALRESVVVIKGGASNQAFLLDLLAPPEVQAARSTSAWLDRLTAKGKHLSATLCGLWRWCRPRLKPTTPTGEWSRHSSTLGAARAASGRSEVGRRWSCVIAAHPTAHEVSHGHQQYRVRCMTARVIDAHIDRLGPFEYWLTSLRDKRFHVVSDRAGIDVIVSKWMAFRIASSAMTAGSCTLRRRQWWSRLR